MNQALVELALEGVYPRHLRIHHCHVLGLLLILLVFLLTVLLQQTYYLCEAHHLYLDAFHPPFESHQHSPQQFLLPLALRLLLNYVTNRTIHFIYKVSSFSITLLGTTRFPTLLSPQKPPLLRCIRVFGQQGR